ncbi:transcription-repair coupling factor (superfamily II helicase) [Bacilli bacterium PM5-3]|nr:transcription-repair coupling factor (superfamily II helicase) [Bacilli bacterium PM5-3]
MNILNNIPFYNIYSDKGFCELDAFEEAVLILQNFLHFKKDIIIIKNNLYSATKLYNELKNYVNDDEIALFGFDESLVVETLASSPELNVQRIETLIKTNNDKAKIIITHSLGLIRPIVDKTSYFDNIQTLKKDEEIDFDKVNDFLTNNGYLKVSKVTMPNEYAIRGSVIDIFSLTHDMPIRIDVFDDVIESIKLFDVTNQRSRINVNEVTIFPASIYSHSESNNIMSRIREISKNNIILDEIETMAEINKDLFFSRYYNLSDKKSSIIEYLNDPIIIISSYDEFIQSNNITIEESYNYLIELENENKSISNYNLFLEWDNLIKGYINIDKYRLNLNQQSLNLFPIDKFKTLVDFINSVKENYNNNYEINICLTRQHDKKIIMNLLEENNLKYSNNEYTKEQINITSDVFNRGFINNDLKIVVYTEKELFYKSKRKNNFLNKYSNATDILNLDELKEGDYIVHAHHGIGKYVGLIQLKVDNIEKDFLHIVYKNNEKLYIPIDQFNLIKKYSSSDTTIPKVSTLGGSDWKKTKLRVQKRIEDMMDELLELYATRQEPIGFKFLADNEIQKEFEDDFEYELTLDQEKAIEDVKKDMESPLVMDRLICGDVGYGKTEVALRAILKAILSNKQAAFLCPTTILSRQHYHTLLERFADYSINIVQLSRNTSPKMVKEIKEDLKNKKIDIVVGTHKLLGKDIEFNDLGLLVIDEEQRFGVKDKEKIKQLRNNIDVLTLSATPIPRTLQMSLSGLRKMSLLQTPPINRVPIQTYVVEKNKYLIKEAIEREIVRNGQVFYLHNRTSDIENVAKDIEDMFDDVKVAIIHGKMSKDQVERVMESFDDNEYNVLVCTTIIETGIDIPNANTIIIEDANNFGLAQLYQIKGRVGRSDRVGYAYLMYQKNREITEDAQKRLQAIKELTKLGSGYKIALRDLSIRGAGDILGKTQAGNIETVGYEMYLEMLQEVIDKRNNVVVQNDDIEPINLKNTGYIPKDYQLDDDNKIKLYQKIYKVKKLEEFNDLIPEINDIYGKLPASIEDIIEKRKFEILVNMNKNIKIFDEAKKITIQLQVNVNDKNTVKKVFSEVDKYGGLVNVEVKYNKIHLIVSKYTAYLKTINLIISDLQKLI